MIHWESFVGIYTQYTTVYLPCNAIIYFLTLRWYTIPEITMCFTALRWLPNNPLAPGPLSVNEKFHKIL